MCSFSNGFVEDSSETVEEHRLLAAVDGVEGGVESGGADADGECCLGDGC